MAEEADKSSIDKLFLHRGIHFVKGMITPEEIDAIEHFPIRDSDVFLVTYPKSGTVWTQQILSLIYHEGHLNKTENIETVDRAPWLEYNLKKVDFEQRPSPRLITTHLPYYLVPKGLKTKKAKRHRKQADTIIFLVFFTYHCNMMTHNHPIRVLEPNKVNANDPLQYVKWKRIVYHLLAIHSNFALLQQKHISEEELQKLKRGWAGLVVIYVTRNPKDNLVSYFHFNNMLRQFSENPTTMMEEHFDDYLNGKVVSGSWFDHVKGWYTHKDEFNILFLHYEDMVKLDVDVITKIRCIRTYKMNYQPW